MSHQGGISVVCVLYQGRKAKGGPQYNPEWVNKLYRGVRRNLQREPRFVCITDWTGPGRWEPEIEKVRLLGIAPGFLNLLEIFRPELQLNRTLFMGLDTLVTGSLEELCGYQGQMGLTGDSIPVSEERRCPTLNAVAMFSQTMADHLWQVYRGRSVDFWIKTTRLKPHQQGSDMVFMYERPFCEPDILTDLFPGQISSWRRQIRPKGDLGNTRLAYFGKGKPNLGLDKNHPFIREHWK